MCSAPAIAGAGGMFVSPLTRRSLSTSAAEGSDGVVRGALRTRQRFRREDDRVPAGGELGLLLATRADDRLLLESAREEAGPRCLEAVPRRPVPGHVHLPARVGTARAARL